MSATLVLKGVVPVIALAAVGAAWMLAGAMPAGLTVLAFILGVLASEVHNLRWTAVEDEAAPASELGDVHAVSAEAAAPEPAAALAEAPATPAEPPRPAMPKRHFRCTCDELAIGSGRSETALAERSRRHAERPAPRRRPEPAAAPPPAPRPAETHTIRFRAAYEAHLTA